APEQSGPGRPWVAPEQTGPGRPWVAPAGSTTPADAAPAGAGSPDPGAQEAADHAAASSAAAQWAAEQLAAAGVTGTPGPTTAPLPPRRRRPLVTILVALLAVFLLIVIVGAVGFTLASGASLRGGVGNRSYTPSQLKQVDPNYRLGMGNLTLDLSEIKFPPRGKTIDASLGMGRLAVTVPSGTCVTVDAHSGVGNVQVLGASNSGFGATLQESVGCPGKTRHPNLTVNAHVGMGSIDVSRR
ncbi:MAG TPA: LiaF domain-containing protein, partial [Acidimicrobiales bacterium]|nr:LiaF domain-containing protein [Acidimicrobiales bacterium]